MSHCLGVWIPPTKDVKGLQQEALFYVLTKGQVFVGVLRRRLLTFLILWIMFNLSSFFCVSYIPPLTFSPCFPDSSVPQDVEGHQAFITIVRPLSCCQEDQSLPLSPLPDNFSVKFKVLGRSSCPLLHLDDSVFQVC